MTLLMYQKPIATFFLVVFLVSQIFLVGAYILTPKPAQAILGFGDLVIKIGDVYQVLKDIALAALRQIAINFANKFLTKFVVKLQSKYKIGNYLYYDKVLTDYYLNQYISDKITDPNLKGIYSLLERGFVSGAPTGATAGTGPDPRLALIPRLNSAINKYYQEQGGQDPRKVSNPANYKSDYDYFSSQQAYYSNPIGYTQQNLQGQFGAFQSSATTSSQLEVLVGNGLKAGRIIGGTCKKPVSSLPGEQLPKPGTTFDTPDGCRANGGTWQASALDQARAFISNPTTFTAGWVDSAIKQITGNNFDPNSYSAMIGSFIGNFLFQNIGLDKSGGTLPDDPDTYQGDTPPTASGLRIA